MWKHNFDSLAGAVTQTLGSLAKAKYNSADFKQTTQLLNNAGVFAAFKNHNEQNQLVKLLVDGDGKPRSFADFKTAAAPIVEQYNKTWLKTEHNQATSNATMAKKWIDFERTRSLYPNLEYRAVGDSHTRPSHAKLDGIIRPIDDPFWDSCYPPNGWGCRCDVVKTDKPATHNQNVPEITPDNGFDNNPGKDGKLFSDSAGYYDVPDDQKKAVTEEALRLMVRESRAQLNVVKQKWVGRQIKVKGLGAVSITGRGWKEAINQPHRNALEKNMALFDVEGLLNSHKGDLFSMPPKMEKNTWVKEVLALEVEIAGEKSWVLLQRLHNDELRFYTIVDKLKKD